MATRHVVGTRLVTSGEFILDGVATDPTVVRCYVSNPAGAVTELVFPSPDITREDVGLYLAQVTTDMPGTWGFRFVGLGDVEAVNEVQVSVAASVVFGA